MKMIFLQQNAAFSHKFMGLVKNVQEKLTSVAYHHQKQIDKIFKVLRNKENITIKVIEKNHSKLLK
jgi:hypothetical protein